MSAAKKKRGAVLPRVVANVSPMLKDWLRRAAEYEREEIQMDRLRGERSDGGQIKVTESMILRRALERELLKIQMGGGPGPQAEAA